MSEVETGQAEDEPLSEEEVPAWEDGYLDTVSSRLMYHYDLEKDFRADGEHFSLYGEMEIHNQKQFLHPSISFAHHVSYEHLFARRTDRVTERELNRLVELGHSLADDWIDPDEEHYSTDFTFVTVAPDIPDEIHSMVTGLDERTLLKYGYNGHYEVNLVVVAPESEDSAANDAADVEEAFRTWQDIERERSGLLRSIARRLQR